MKRQIKTLAELIRLKRKAKGLTQQQLAERAGVSPTWITKIEKGALPSTFIISSIALALDDDDEIYRNLLKQQKEKKDHEQAKKRYLVYHMPIDLVEDAVIRKEAKTVFKTILEKMFINKPKTKRELEKLNKEYIDFKNKKIRVKDLDVMDEAISEIAEELLSKSDEPEKTDEQKIISDIEFELDCIEDPERTEKLKKLNEINDYVVSTGETSIHKLREKFGVDRKIIKDILFDYLLNKAGKDIERSLDEQPD